MRVPLRDDGRAPRGLYRKRREDCGSARSIGCRDMAVSFRHPVSVDHGYARAGAAANSFLMIGTT